MRMVVRFGTGAFRGKHGPKQRQKTPKNKNHCPPPPPQTKTTRKISDERRARPFFAPAKEDMNGDRLDPGSSCHFSLRMCLVLSVCFCVFLGGGAAVTFSFLLFVMPAPAFSIFKFHAPANLDDLCNTTYKPWLFGFRNSFPGIDAKLCYGA
jgi:hypothetical protein